MRSVLRHGLALAGVTLLLAGGCSSDDSPSTTAATGASSTSGAPATTTAALATTSAPPTSAAPAAPAVAEAGGWRLVVTAPTRGATIGPAVDLCYALTGPAQGNVALDVAFVQTQTETVASSSRVAASVGTGSVRISPGTLDPRFYDMTVQGVVNGQPVDRLLVRFGVRFGTTAPAGCP